MTIAQLKYLLAVAKHKNFTVAAEQCNVTQPTLSMQIQKLEDELDVLIFNRKKKPLQLTAIGEKVLEQAKVIVSESDRITDIVEQHKGFIGGDFRLGIIPTITPTLLPLFLKTFTNRYPKVNLNIDELTTETIIRKLKDGHIDVGIAATPLEDPSIKEQALYYEPFVGFVGNNHRLFQQNNIAIDDLDLNDMLLLEEGHCFKDSILNLCQTLNNTTKSFQLTSGSFNTLINLSKEGLGMTLLPYLQTLDLSDKDKKHLREFNAPVPAREVSIISHKSQLKSHMVQALKDTISAVIRGVIAFSDVKIVSPLKYKKG
jgi:LysR family hydrogen peroxide-inducible transcriptional activator